MKNIFYIILASLLMVACKKDEKVVTPPTPAKQWQKYIGVYDVYDTAHHTQWIMEIKFLSYADIIRSDGNNDSLFMQNFANKFNIRFRFGTCTNPNVLLLPFIFPLKDKTGYSWSYSGNTDDTLTPYLENELKNDSIILYFKQSNIAFYQSEGVPYYACDCKHIAVKRK